MGKTSLLDSILFWFSYRLPQLLCRHATFILLTEHPSLFDGYGNYGAMCEECHADIRVIIPATQVQADALLNFAPRGDTNPS
jgi:hypothetical protein